MAMLAFMTIGILHEPFEHPSNRSFRENASDVFAAAALGDGHLCHVGQVVDGVAVSMGEFVAPRCFAELAGPERIAPTLSVWRDIESVLAFAYHGVHGDAMKRRKEWFGAKELPEYVAWWAESVEEVTWADGASRLDLLHETGPTPSAFNFMHPFDATGAPYAVETQRVRKKVAMNGSADR